METIYCYNDPCETEATHFYTTSKGAKFYLCYTCKEAFELGQVNAEAELTDIDDEDIETLIGLYKCSDCGFDFDEDAVSVNLDDERNMAECQNPCCDTMLYPEKIITEAEFEAQEGEAA